MLIHDILLQNSHIILFKNLVRKQNINQFFQDAGFYKLDNLKNKLQDIRISVQRAHSN